MNLKGQIAECDSQMWRDHHRDLGSSSWGHIFGPWNGSTGPTCPNQSGTGLGTFLYAWNTEGLTSHFMYELNFHWAVLFGEPKLDGFRRWTWPSPFSTPFPVVANSTWNWLLCVCVHPNCCPLSSCLGEGLAFEGWLQSEADADKGRFSYKLCCLVAILSKVRFYRWKRSFSKWGWNYRTYKKTHIRETLAEREFAACCSICSLRW